MERSTAIVGGLVLVSLAGLGGFALARAKKPRSQCQADLLARETVQSLAARLSTSIAAARDPRSTLARLLAETGCERLLAPYEETESSIPEDRNTDPRVIRELILPAYNRAIKDAMDLGRLTTIAARQYARVVLDWSESSWTAAGVPHDVQQTWLNDSGLLAYFLDPPKPPPKKAGVGKIQG